MSLVARQYSKILLGLAIFVASPLGVLAADRCSLQYALVGLRHSPMISQNDVSLILKGLVTPGEESMLCGPTCSFHLMEAMRKALEVKSRFKTPADEIEAMAKVGYFLGRKVDRDGMTLDQIRAAVAGNLSLHDIRAEAQVLTTMEAPPQYGATLQKRARLELSDFEAPAGQEQANLLALSRGDSMEGGHIMLADFVDTQSGLISLIDPAQPERQLILKLVHQNPRDPKSPLVLVSPLAEGAPADSRASIQVREFIRVRIPSSK